MALPWQGPPCTVARGHREGSTSLPKQKALDSSISILFPVRKKGADPVVRFDGTRFECTAHTQTRTCVCAAGDRWGDEVVRPSLRGAVGPCRPAAAR